MCFKKLHIKTKIFKQYKHLFFGFGYNLGASRIDFVLTTLSFDENKLMKYSGISSPANIKTERTNFGISFVQNF